MIDAPSAVRRAYRSAQDSILAVHHADSGLLTMKGADRLDFLERMSTQHLLDLSPPARRRTVLTNALGRIVDLLTVLAADDHLLLLTSQGKGPAVKAWLEGYLFFQDEVTIEDDSENWEHWGLFGPGATPAAEEMIAAADSPLPCGVIHGAQGHRWPEHHPLPGIQLLLRGPARARAAERWPDAGPNSPAAAALEVLRIEAGMPKAGAEITEEVTPLDVGLESAVSFEKGCYIGQEVIARMENRGRRRRLLRHISLDAKAETGADIRHGDRIVGQLTSLAASPRFGWIGLALLRPRLLDDSGLPLRVGDEGVPAHLNPLDGDAEGP